jgi:hypothetical protein
MVEFQYHTGKRRKMQRVFADVLSKLGKGFVVEEASGLYSTSALKASEPQTADTLTSAADEISPRTGKPKRQYRRRDMRAED